MDELIKAFEGLTIKDSIVDVSAGNDKGQEDNVVGGILSSNVDHPSPPLAPGWEDDLNKAFKGLSIKESSKKRKPHHSRSKMLDVFLHSSKRARVVSDVDEWSSTATRSASPNSAMECEQIQEDMLVEL